MLVPSGKTCSFQEAFQIQTWCTLEDVSDCFAELPSHAVPIRTVSSYYALRVTLVSQTLLLVYVTQPHSALFIFIFRAGIRSIGWMHVMGRLSPPCASKLTQFGAKEHWLTLLNARRCRWDFSIMGFQATSSYIILQDKWTPLIFAAREGHLDIVKALVDKGSVIDHADVVGVQYQWLISFV